MYLKRLEIYGFKTFAQRTVFEFPPGVTAVVGPNGSGKSNVADALRWVLGEQSFANLRSKRTEDLIFGGGKSRAPMGFAEVFLTIDNSDRLLPLPYDEVTIGRRAYRNGENEYTLNQARVRLRDVADAVAPLGSSYTLINQGLVDSVLALQPEDRRRLFEDAAEIGPYQAKKQEAQRRLRETEANLVRLNDVVAELEPQLRSLKRQARDAEAVGAVEAELHGLLRQFYAAAWARATERLQQANTEAARLADELAQRSAAREQAANELRLAREQLKVLRARVEQQRIASAKLNEQLAATMREQAVVTERVAGFEQRRVDLERRREDVRAGGKAADGRIQELHAQIAAAEATLVDARSRLAAAESAIQLEIAARRAAEQALATRRTALVRSASALEAERSRLAELQHRHAMLNATVGEIASAVSHNRRHVAELEAEAETAQKAVFEAEQRIVAISKTVDAQRSAVEQAQRERQQCDQQITAAQRGLGELQARFDALTRLARSYEGTFAGVRAALQWAAREHRPGFVLVSSVLRVPTELETAIEVALGARLQQIVVERWADAEAAIAQLKQSGSGRATFLPLDTLKPSRRMNVPHLLGIRGIAADLVEVDPHYEPIRSYLLGRTLVADDLQAARRALPELEGGWTIVTLGGEQIASGGAVTGGAATKESGTLRRERELRDLPRQVAAASDTVVEHEAARSRLTQRIEHVHAAAREGERWLREARSERDRLQRRAEAKQREAHRAEDELAALLRRETEQRHEQTTVAQRMASGQTALATAQSDHARVMAEVEAAQVAVDQQLAVVGTDEDGLRDQQKLVARITAELSSLAAELRAQQEVAQRSTAEQNELEQQLLRLLDERTQLVRQVTDREAQQAALQADLSQRNAQLGNEQATVRDQERALEQLEAEERELTAQTLAAESGHAEVAVELERRRAERDLLWERAAEDNVDVETLTTSDELMHNIPLDDLAPRIEQLRGRLRRMGPVNALAPAEYSATEERYRFLSAQLADVRGAVATLRTAIEQLDQVMHEHFETTFTAVAHEFSRTFTQLFGGGTARLVLVHAENGADGVQGIEIIAQPPGKRQLNLQLLSGGERALTAAALLFAILTVNPSPFCMLDEVDAALDEANVVRFREALLTLAQQTQFILITHNRGTVEAADTLYGITMAPDGGSRVLSLRLEEVAEDGSLALGVGARD